MNFATSFLPAVTQKLTNGLTVILQPIAITNAVTVDIWVQAGGRHESPDLLGMSHFLEHMVFKGTERLKPGDLDRAVEGRGGITNAATGQDYTHYYITVAAEDLAETFPYLAEVVTQAAIPEDEFERERQVVLEEIRRAADNPDYLAYHQLMSTVYQQHPYGRPVLGTPEVLLSFTPELMRQYHRRWYSPENMTVVMVGNLDMDAAMGLVEQYFGGLPAGGDPLLPSLPPEPPLTGIRRAHLQQPRLEQARLLMAWPTVGVKHWQETCGLEMLASILGDGRTSRLVNLLREQRGWVRGVGCSAASQQEQGLFYVSAYLDPMQIEMVEQAILAEMGKLQQTPIPQEELERTRRILVNEFVFSTESPHQLASVYGYYHLMGGVELALDYLQQVRSLTAQQLQELAAIYLSPAAYVVTTLCPEVVPDSFTPPLELVLH
ncbi:MAG: pitrilysin family protein [Cyanobacteriota bacterium]|nr:pitrilysin family protein [Cyanobacteriota bacterium]